MESYYICKRCVWCQKPLTKIGYARVNGKSHEDWLGRNTHKKCWLENEVKFKRKRPPNEAQNLKQVINLGDLRCKPLEEKSQTYHGR